VGKRIERKVCRDKREGEEKTRKGKEIAEKEGKELGIRKEKGIGENEGERNWREWRGKESKEM